MKIAIIDMGTNTFHLMIVEVKGGSFSFIHRDKRPVRIGENGINDGKITEEAMKRALITLKEFKDVIESHEITLIKATATSAIRNAKNGQELVDLIKANTGIAPRIISGVEEAELIYFGVKKALDIGPEPALIMDIGGGSIEFVIGTNTDIIWRQSFEIGGQRLLEKFHGMDPISLLEIDSLRSYLELKLEDLFKALDRVKVTTLIGSSGTFDTLSEIHAKSLDHKIDPDATEYPLTTESFHTIHNDLVSKNRSQRLQIPGMIEMRVDMIVVASILLKYVIEKVSIKKIRVSAYALKEGVLLDAIENQVQIS